MGNYMWRDEINTAGIYHNPTLGLISFSSDGQNWITIADKNLGATTVYNNGDTVTASNSGGYFQWGNIHEFSFAGASGSQTTTQVDASAYGPDNYYNGSSYYYTGSTTASTRTWDSSNNKDLWGDVTNTNAARKGPCSTGFHIWSYAELGNIMSLIETITGTNYQYRETNMKKYLLMPPAGQIWWTSYTPRYQGTYCGYRASSPADNAGFPSTPYNGMGIGTDGGNLTLGTFAKCCGFNIRPMSNSPVIPDSTRTVLYPSS